MPFRIIEVETGEPYRSPWTHCVLEFETGDEAQSRSKELADITGRKYRVKKVLNTQWRDREQRKFEDGTYQCLPWAYDSWWNDPKAREIHQHHFAHPSRKEPGMIAYVASEEKGMDNIVTRIKPGRYLEQFASILKVYGVDLHRLAKEFDCEYAPRELRFAVTEDEIQWVYENGPPSCMSTKTYRKKNGWGYPSPGEWPTDWHACRAYAAGDLQVAWIAKDDEKPIKRSNVLSRAVVWPEKKTHSRCYGDEHKLKTVLMANGYSFHPPLGAKLLRKPFQDKFIVPYLDVGANSGDGSMWVRDDKTHLTIVRRGSPLSYSASGTSGLSGGMVDETGHPVMVGTCQRCNAENVPFNPVFRSGTDMRYWCNDCRDQHAFRCQYEGRWYDREAMDPVEMHDGAMWSRRAFNSQGFTCDATGRRYNRQYMVKLATGEKWCADYAATHAASCYYTGHKFKIEDLTKVYVDGAFRLFGKDALDLYAAKCVECEKFYYNRDRTAYIKPRANGDQVCFKCEQLDLPIPGQASVNSLTQRT